MITLLLAFINGKYKCDYTLLFMGTLLIDVTLIELVFKLLA